MDMFSIEKIKEKILSGATLSKQESLFLVNAPLDELCDAADQIRRKLCGNTFDICTIINGKSGRCSEDCKYCAQSACYKTEITNYPLLSEEKILEQAKYNDEKGVLRYSIVTSGKKLSDSEIEQVCKSIRRIKEQTKISVCVSFGLLNEEQFRRTKEAGATRVHNNLESSRNYFSKICTTHTFDDKIEAIKAAKRAGLHVCSGGIMGLGESMEDRIDMAFSLQKLKIKSVPINMLNPIPGTPFETNESLTNDDMCRIVAIFRFILPDAFIRLAGGRGLLPDKGRKCFLSGANAAISGDMLSTAGISIEEDMRMIEKIGYKVEKNNE